MIILLIGRKLTIRAGKSENLSIFTKGIFIFAFAFTRGRKKKIDSLPFPFPITRELSVIVKGNAKYVLVYHCYYYFFFFPDII